MSDKCSFRNIGDAKIPPPKSAHDLLLEQQERLRQKKPDITMYFTGEHCESCEAPIYTDGTVFFCKPLCWNNGKRGKGDHEGFEFMREMVR